MNTNKEFLRTVLLLVILGCGCTPAAAQPGLTPSATLPVDTLTPTEILPTATSIPKVLLPVRGLYTQFDRRGYPSQYWSGQVIREFNDYDEVVGHTVKEEVALQLDEMRAMGVNTIAFELRSAASSYIPGPHVPPTCNLGPDLGLQYPRPTEQETTNLVSFLDLLESKGIKVYLRLVNSHMEGKPNTENQLWLGTILNAIKGHPALDLVLFEGGPFTIDTDLDGVGDICGGVAEPALWEGAGTVSALYVKWALDYAHSLGYPWRQLSAEAIVGDFFTLMQPENPFNTDGHFWDPIFVLKGIFDSLEVPDDQRTYAISFYEHRKCSTAKGIPCEVDMAPHAWAIETVENLFSTIGRGNGARVVAVEMGLLNPVEDNWTAAMALESLVWIMQTYGIEGGCLWRWTTFENYEEMDPTLQMPVKKRGSGFEYTPLKDVLVQLYTQGQANDLSLVPEGFPPVFSAVTVSPTEIKNREPFVISAALGETHLIVTADLSVLDPTLEEPALLTQSRDGIYQATLTLEGWNSASNGAKTIRINAMDFWSNTASYAAAVTLDNPPPLLDSLPPDDAFSGKLLDGAKWVANSSGGGSVSQEERLTLVTGNQEAFSATGVTSTWDFRGDFDVQVDFELGEGWASPANGHLDGAFLAVTIDAENYRITRLRSSNQDKFLSYSSTGALVNDAASSSLNGKYRLVRRGTTLYLLFDVGEGWQELASTSVPASGAQVNLGNGSIDASLAFTSYFDSFRINSGLTTYRP